jgi:hypothetical protein
MKLISMSDYVLEQNKKLNNATEAYEQYCKIVDYANFLKQPLKLEMFVPCDENGNVLEKPEFYYKQENLKHLKGMELLIAEETNKRVSEYQKAKEKVLFDNFKFVNIHKEGIDNNLDYFVFPWEDRFGLTKKEDGFRTWFQLFTVEDLIKCDLDCAVTF